MDWFAAQVDVPLVVVRAIHFAATAVLAGSLMFRAVVAAPGLCSDLASAGLVRMQTLQTASIGLAIAILSGAIWLLLLAISMSGLPFREAMTADVLSTVLNQTQFGLVFQIRLLLAVILAGCLIYDRLTSWRWLGLLSALGLTASIAWTGHAASTLGGMGVLHLAADALHLIAAAAWIGGLISLARLLAGVRDDAAHGSRVREATRRFSMLGMASVGTLLLTGVVNTWILAGSLHAIAVTAYGRLLTLKVGLFVVMVGFAAVNRFWLMPQLVRGPEPQIKALGHLTRNSIIEIVLGFAIFAVVGVLGTLHPAIHFL
jgi:copper resistance protein D